jgi:hypothetical protein
MLLLGNGNIYTYNEKHDVFASTYNPFILPKNWKPIWLSYSHQYKSYWISCDSGLVKFNAKNKTISYRNYNTDHDAVINAFLSSKVLLQSFFDRSGTYEWNMV